ncbi:MAG: hypothetical protein Q4C98_05450 [Capnocytophaga sp.]|nr:hypothetical protein [Capnocytophaga sp.]
MKRFILSFAVLFPLLGKAQTENIQGTYYAKESNFRINPDGTFDVISFSGKYTLDKDGTLHFQSDRACFVVEEKAKGTSSTLKINFTSESFIEYFKYIYVGYEDANKQIKYENLYNKISENQTVNNDEEYIAKPQTYTFEIPQTDNLYLVNAFSLIAYGYRNTNQKNVIVEKYPIERNISELAISCDFMSLYSPMQNLQGRYDATNESLLISYYGELAPTVFQKQTENNQKNNIKIASQEEITNWEHLITFDNDLESTSVATRVKLDIKNTLDEALKSAKKNNRPLLVFYQPENTEASKAEFEALIEKYEEELSSYSEDSFSEYDKLDFYFANTKDNKWFKNKKLSAKNQLVLLDNDGEVLYHQEGTPNEVAGDFFVHSSLFLVFQSVYTASKIDRILSDNKATVPQIENAFSLLFKNPENPYFAIVSEEDATATLESGLLYDTDYYKTKLKNKANLYKFKTTQDQASRQWKKMVDTHSKDSELSVNYADILAINYQMFAESYLEKLFKIKKEFDQTDIDALHYLVKFYKNIQAHNENQYLLNDDANHQFIGVYGNDISSVLNQISEKQPNTVGKIKEIYAEGEQNNVFRYEEFTEFLGKYFPEEHFQFFEKYYQKMTSADANIILSLDKIYSDNKNLQNQYSDWTYYKLFFANNCNDVAWKVVENHKNDPSKIEKALKWSATSLEVEKENPYYLDTYAHLLYFAGKKDKAIEMQRKAVNILDKAKQIYNQGNEDSIRDVLKKMESGSL